jgi:hypothetical protein
MEIVATVRDVAIIALALESLVVIALLVVLIWEVLRLVRMLRDDIKPILQSADETARTVRGTTTFVSENFVSPVVKVSSVATGVVEALRILTRRQ